jgi:hypothetical protein
MYSSQYLKSIRFSKNYLNVLKDKKEEEEEKKREKKVVFDVIVYKILFKFELFHSRTYFFL